MNKCSDRSIEVKLPALLGHYDKTDWPANKPTNLPSGAGEKNEKWGSEEKEGKRGKKKGERKKGEEKEEKEKGESDFFVNIWHTFVDNCIST